MSLYEGEVFMTKYALSRGVVKIRGRQTDLGGGGTVYFHEDTVSGYLGHFLSSRDYAITVADAEAQVAKKLAAKVKAAEKQLLKLKSLSPQDIVAKCQGQRVERIET